VSNEIKVIQVRWGRWRMNCLRNSPASFTSAGYEIGSKFCGGSFDHFRGGTPEDHPLRY
jgi:hypothetical protein